MKPTHFGIYFINNHPEPGKIYFKFHVGEKNSFPKSIPTTLRTPDMVLLYTKKIPVKFLKELQDAYAQEIEPHANLGYVHYEHTKKRIKINAIRPKLHLPSGVHVRRLSSHLEAIATNYLLRQFNAENLEHSSTLSKDRKAQLIDMEEPFQGIIPTRRYLKGLGKRVRTKPE